MIAAARTRRTLRCLVDARCFSSPSFPSRNTDSSAVHGTQPADPWASSSSSDAAWNPPRVADPWASPPRSDAGAAWTSTPADSWASPLSGDSEAAWTSTPAADPWVSTLSGDGEALSSTAAAVANLSTELQMAADPDAHGVLWVPVEATQNLLGVLHIYGDWVMVALAVPWLLKGIQLPLTIYAQRKLKREEPHVQDTMEQMQDLQRRFSHDEPRLRAELGALFEKRGNPVKAQLLPLVAPMSLVPFQISLFLAFRTMHERFPSWHFEGWWWIKDLSVSDPTFILPIAVGFLTAGHMTDVARSIPDQKLANNMQVFGLVMAGMSIPMMHVFGTGFNIYCLSNIVANMAQSSLLRNAEFRKYMKLKPSPIVDQTEDQKAQHKMIRVAIALQLTAVGLFLYVARDLFSPQKESLSRKDKKTEESVESEAT